jgi:hypothetical protein
MMHIEMIGVVSGCGPWSVDAANGSDEVYMWYVALSNVGDDREQGVVKLPTSSFLV